MPDVIHVDHLIIVVRFCYNGNPSEIFVAFLPIENNSSTILVNKIQKVLSEPNKIEHILNQSYDKASKNEALGERAASTL